jgi:uncharacterized repeat protein (TIGR03803 family)
MLAMVFALMLVSLQAAAGQPFSVIHDFTGAGGYGPYSGVTLDAAGNLYGTTSLSSTGLGTVFELKRSNSSWLLNTLVNFVGGNGAIPYIGVIFGPVGALFGTTNSGGSKGYGNVYSLRPPNTVCKTALCPWTETVLYEFAGGSDGAGPGLGNLVFDPAGNIYGTTIGGGASGLGTVYQLTPANGGWTESVLYTFAGGSDGAAPWNAVLFDAAGNNAMSSSGQRLIMPRQIPYTRLRHKNSLHYGGGCSIRPFPNRDHPNVDGFSIFELWVQHDRRVGNICSPCPRVHVRRVNHHMGKVVVSVVG